MKTTTQMQLDGDFTALTLIIQQANLVCNHVSRSAFQEHISSIIQTRAEKTAYARAYYETHRNELLAKMRIYRAAHCKEIAAQKVAYRAAHQEDRAIYMRTYYAAHREENHAKCNAYYTTHKEEILAYNTAYRATNKGKSLTYAATYRATHKKEIAAYDVTHRKKKTSYMAAYRVTHAEEMREGNRKRRALKRGATIAPIDFKAIKIRDRMICAICGKKVAMKDLSFDHSVPLALGGDHSQHNLRVSHLHCNIRRGAGRLPVQIVLC